MAKAPRKKAVTKAKTNARKASTKSAKNVKRPLDPIRKELNILVKEANKRANILLKKGYASRALFEAQKTLPPSRRNSEELFESNLRDTRALNREFARVNKFLNDWTSMSKGAESFSREFFEMKNVWGGNFEGGFDATKLSSDFATKAFEIYDRIIEQNGGWDRVIGFFRDENAKVAFGSEVLLNAIYDMQVQGLSEEEIYSRANAMVDAAIGEFDKMAVLQRSNIDYGKILDQKDPRSAYYQWMKSSSKESYSNWRAARHRRRGNNVDWLS